MNIMIYQFSNRFFNSNCYIIEIDKTDACIVIDPGLPVNAVKDFFIKKNKFPAAVLLTHEHADHCAGVNELHQMYPFVLYCSEKCAANIKNSKENLSEYVEEIETFVVEPVPEIVDEKKVFNVEGIDIKVIQMPGHSPGSVFYIIKDAVFTGDSLMKDIKTPLHFLHSNKSEYEKTIIKINTCLKSGMTVYPGHGEIFVIK